MGNVAVACVEKARRVGADNPTAVGQAARVELVSIAVPPRLPSGSKVRATGWLDNSPNNPANPDATNLVKWEPQTTDEMMIGYVGYSYATEPPKIAER